jgi:thiol:disulfide interchange protein
MERPDSQPPSHSSEVTPPEKGCPLLTKCAAARRVVVVVVGLGLIAVLAVAASKWTIARQADGPLITWTPEKPAPKVPASNSLKVGGDATAKDLPETVWQTDFDKAIAIAAERKQPVLLRFTATWCAPCQIMERSVFPDARVKQLLAENVIPLKLDIDDEANAELAWRYKTAGIPTLILIDAEGKVLDRGGFMSAEEVVRFLRVS